MARIFVSHSSDDPTAATHVRAQLVLSGHDVFLDLDRNDGIPVGKNWKHFLYDELRRTDAMICLVSSAYLASRWCDREIAIAQALGTQIFPLSLQTGLRHPLLDEIEHEDYSTDPTSALAAIDRALRGIEGVTGSWEPGRSPFPGLLPYEPDMQRVFFGRAHETSELAALLRAAHTQGVHEIVTVVGPSGCGKSSLVRAGLLPAMAHEREWWVVPPIVFGSDPVATLAKTLATEANRLGCGWTIPDVLARLAEAEGLVGVTDELLVAASVSGRRSRLLIVIDQMEELLTRVSAEKRADLARILVPAVKGPTTIVTTLRPEFLSPLLASPELGRLVFRPVPLRPLDADALATIIREPCRMAGIRVDADLVRSLVTDTASGEALPLLAYTLEQLVVDVGYQGHLSYRRYREIGGVTGALVRQADTALSGAMMQSGRSSNDVISSLLRLVTVDENGQPTRRRVPYAGLPDATRVELGAFVDQRLLTVDEIDDYVSVGVAHEAVLTGWPPLADAIGTAGIALRTLREVERAADDWRDAGRPRRLLWERGRLASALENLGIRSERVGRNWFFFGWFRTQQIGTSRLDVQNDDREFLRASVRRDRLVRRRAVTVLTILLVSALAATGIAFLNQADARQQERLATARQLIAKARSTVDRDPQTATRLSLAADKILPSEETRSGVLATLTRLRYPRVLKGESGSVSAIASSPDGNTLAVASVPGAPEPEDTGQLRLQRVPTTKLDEGSIVIWDVSNPAQPRRLSSPLTGHVGGIWAMAFSADNLLLAIGDGGGYVTVRELSDRGRAPSIARMFAGGQPVLAITFVPGTRTVMAVTSAGSVAAWNLAEPRKPQLLSRYGTRGVGSAITAAALSIDGRVLATGGADGTVVLWDVAKAVAPRRIGRPINSRTGAVTSIALTQSHDVLATGTDEGSVTLWNLETPTSPRPFAPSLSAHRGQVWSVAFSNDARTLATSGEDASVVLWDLSDPVRPQRIDSSLGGAHSRPALFATFTSDGFTLASGSADGNVTLWDLADRSRPQRLGDPLVEHNGPVWDIAFTQDGGTMASAGNDGSVIVWDTRDPARPRRIDRLLTNTGAVHSVALSPNGRTLAAGSAGTVVLWDLADRERPRKVGVIPSGGPSWVWSIAFSPDGRALATSGQDSEVTIWNVADIAHPRMTAEIETDGTPARSLEFSPEGDTLAVGLDSGKLLLVDVTEPASPRVVGRPLGDHIGWVWSVAFSRNRHLLATASDDGTVNVWNLDDQKNPERVSQVLAGNSFSEFSVAFAPDGLLLAAGGGDNTTMLWDIVDESAPRVVGQLVGHSGPVLSLAFSAGGRILATGGSDSRIILWSMAPLLDIREDATELACAFADGGLTRTQWRQLVPNLQFEQSCP